ncbi:LPXTG cell wall anchor domain-containing protein [Arthrobacter sp. ZGTC412]|uniref:LPXTG cell wall anchor domain-containing protein n=1 Tax=Arthrobacter sp. ZGTC412 TaxID=2058900 RepID=UPI002158604F|nr:LPXTG cell wall anchor domain-containing protein [Arthrobacter sp. ZGTC412]
MKRAITTLGVLGLAAFAAAAPAVADRGGADDDKVVVCHAGSGSNSGHFSTITVAVPSMNGHDEHGADIIPPNDGMEYGQNWDAVGRAIHAAGCVVTNVDVPPVVPPVVVPPVVPPVVVNPPVVNPPVVKPPVVDAPVVPPVVVVQPVDPPAVAPPVANQPVVNPPAGAPAADQSTVVPPSAVPAQATAPQAATGVPAAGATANANPGTNQGYNAQTAVGGPDSAPSWLAGMGALLAAGGVVAFRRKSRTLRQGD